MIFNEETFALVFHEFRRQGKHQDEFNIQKKDRQLMEIIELIITACKHSVPADLKSFILQLSESKDKEKSYADFILGKQGDAFAIVCMYLFNYAGTWNLKYAHARKEYLDHIESYSEKPALPEKIALFDIIKTIVEMKTSSFPGGYLGEALGKIEVLAKSKKIDLKKHFELRFEYEKNYFCTT